MRCIAMTAVLGWVAVLGAAEPAQNEPIVGFPGYAELGRLRRDPNDTRKPPEITEKTEIGGKHLAEWVKLLKDSKDSSDRERAIDMILNYGPVAQDMASAALMHAITDEDVG